MAQLEWYAKDNGLCNRLFWVDFASYYLEYPSNTTFPVFPTFDCEIYGQFDICELWESLIEYHNISRQWFAGLHSHRLCMDVSHERNRNIYNVTVLDLKEAPQLHSTGVLPFGRYHLNVTLNVHCLPFTLDPVLDFCYREDNCTALNTKMYFSGASDYDILPPSNLRHSHSSTMPSFSCVLSDVFTLGFITKWIFSDNTGYVEAWMAASVRLATVDLIPIIFDRHFVNGFPLVTFRHPHGLTYVIPDAIYTDLQLYGGVLNYAYNPPLINGIHFTASSGVLDIWSLQLDFSDVLPMDCAIEQIGSTDLVMSSPADYLPPANCTLTRIDHLGSFHINTPVYLVCVKTQPCLMNITFDNQAVQLLRFWYPCTTISLPALTQVLINGIRVTTPAVRTVQPDFGETTLRVSSSNGWFMLVEQILTFFYLLFDKGPVHLLELVYSHLLDIFCVLLTWFSARKLNYQWMFVCGVYGYIRLHQFT